MDTIISYGIIYLLVFRLAVLLLGGLCIFWGYRLFLSLRQQAGDIPSSDQGSELHGRIGGSELKVKSTAPGIFFAAFGALIVIAVLSGQQPAVTYRTVRRPAVKTKHRRRLRLGVFLCAIRRAALCRRMRVRQATAALSVIFPRLLPGSGQQSAWPRTTRIIVTCWPVSSLPGVSRTRRRQSSSGL